MTTKNHRYFWIVLLAFITGCGIAPGQPIATVATTPTASLTTFPTFESLPGPTASTAISTTTPLPLSLPKFPLDGYVMLFTKDGYLYFQDGENTPVKLTHIGDKSHFRILSEDNQKIVFSRGDGNEYSINTDGTEEKVIITSEWTASLEPGTKMGTLDFIPGTHQLLFETALCESQEFRTPCSTSIFLVDTDKGDIKKLADLGLSIQQDSIPRSIKVSPDGKMVAVGTKDSVDILTMDGKIIRDNILSYKPSQSTVLFPSLFWFPDSSGLIVALPNTFYDSNAYSDFPASTIWRYTLNSNAAVQILFDPPPMLDTFQVSPDGNWIVYGGLGNDPMVYLGNLTDGHLQTFGDAYQVNFSWGPDSRYFIATSAGSVIGNIDMPNLQPTCHLLQWLDSGHFTCYSAERIRMAEIDSGAILIYDLGFDRDIEYSLFIKPK